MLSQDQINNIRSMGRTLELAKTNDPTLGPLQLLPGLWKNLPGLPGRGWNMIALPFATEPQSPINYRLLVNQYNEELRFSLVDKAVPNRGIKRNGTSTNSDQFIVTLDYEQTIKQIAADDFPRSGLAGPAELPIHHEPGLLLHMTNETSDGLDIARLATIPHGDSVLALGRDREVIGAIDIFEENGLPIGVNQDLSSPYLAPYKHFHDNLFEGLFDPVRPHLLLAAANQGVNIVRTIELTFDTKLGTGGITNIPFIVDQANATEMKATFWIQELADLDAAGHNKLRLQYIQTVFLDFFQRRDGQPGLIRWPHVSINTLEKA
ncbi:MAG: heme-binding protein [Thiobacillus sp.]